MTLLTNKLTNEQREDLRKRIGNRKQGEPVSLFNMPHVPTTLPPPPMTQIHRENVRVNHKHNPVDANVGLNAHYKGGCCGGQ